MQVGSIHMGVMYSMHVEGEVHIFGLHVCVLICMHVPFLHCITLNIPQWGSYLTRVEGEL